MLESNRSDKYCPINSSKFIDYNDQSSGNFLKKTLHDQFGLYSTQYRICSDYDFIIKVTKNDQIKIFRLEQIINNFTLNGISANTNLAFEVSKIQLHNNLISKNKYFFKDNTIYD